VSCTQKVQNHQTERGETGEKQSQEQAHHKESVLAVQTVSSHTTVMFYGHCVKIWEDFAPNFGDKTTGCCITMHHLTLPFSPGIFFFNFFPPSTLLFFVSPIEDETEKPPF
jgi:hypothetical protein